MAINEISNTTPVPPATVESQPRAAATAAPATQAAAAPAPAAPSAPATVAAEPGLTPAQEAQLLINETLQGLNFLLPNSPESLVINEANPLIDALEISQGLEDADQLNEAAINETLLDLSPLAPPAANPLLIDETPAILETLEETQNLTATQQAETAVNATLQNVTTAPPVLTPTEEAASGEMLAGLRAALPFLRRELGARMRIRRVPELRFEMDLGVAHGRRIEELLHEVAAADQRPSVPDAGVAEDGEAAGAADGGDAGRDD